MLRLQCKIRNDIQSAVYMYIHFIKIKFNLKAVI